MSVYYDRDGKLIDRDAWARLMEDHEYQRVAETMLPNGYWVSTVWIGLDHRFGPGSALIFETMVFARNNTRAALNALGGEPFALGRSYDEQRYATEVEARAGHAALCEKWAMVDDDVT